MTDKEKHRLRYLLVEVFEKSLDGPVTAWTLARDASEVLARDDLEQAMKERRH